VMFLLSWQLTLVALLVLPAFLLPARFMGRKLEAIMRESYELSAEMNTTMVERFNVSGALLVKLFGRPGDEDRTFRDRAGRVRDISVQRGMYARIFFVSLMLTAALATALVYGWGGMLALQGTLSVGTVVAMTAYLNRLYGPITSLSNINVDVMTTLVSFERIFEVLDLPPMIQEKPDAVALTRGGARLEFDHVDFAYPTASEVSLASLESIATVERPDRAHRRDVRRGAGRTRGARGAFGSRQDDHEPARAPPLRRRRRRDPGQRRRRARREARLAARRGWRRHPGHAPVPRHDPGEPPVRQAGCVGNAAHVRHRASPGPAARTGAARRPGHGRRRPRVPPLGRREAAHRHRAP
jgi:ABC-type multidrug transport system fused ATPase/permease subunit